MIYDKAARTIHFHGDIYTDSQAKSGDLCPQAITDALTALGRGPVLVRVDTRGGSIDAAFKIADILNAHAGQVSIHVDALCASAGTVLLANPRWPRSAEPDAILMIHRVWTMTSGDADDHRMSVNVLDQFDEMLTAAYQNVCLANRAAIFYAMKQETYFTADEARTFGLIDSVEALPGNQRDWTPKMPAKVKRYSPNAANKSDAADVTRCNGNRTRQLAAMRWCKVRQSFHGLLGVRAHHHTFRVPGASPPATVAKFPRVAAAKQAMFRLSQELNLRASK